MRTVDAHHIENRLQMCGTYHGVIAYDTVISVLHDAPTVEPQQWIPVSSGNLPKVEIEPYYEDEHEVLRESKQVLMWAKNPNNGKYGYALGTLINIDGDEKRYEWDGVFNDVDGIDPYHPEHVIAWMLLPSPFREGGEA